MKYVKIISMEKQQHLNKGVGRKNFQVGSTEKKTEKIAKKTKIALLNLFQGGGGQRKKTEKWQKDRKIALLSLYLLYLYLVMKIPCPPLPTPMHLNP